MPRSRQEEEEEEIDEIDDVDPDEEPEETEEPEAPVVAAPPPRQPPKRRKKRVGAGSVVAQPELNATDAHLYWLQLLGVVQNDPQIGGANGVAATVKRVVNGQLQLCGVIDGSLIEGNMSESADEACLRYILEHFHCYCPENTPGQYKVYFTAKRSGKYLGTSNLNLPPYNVMVQMNQRAVPMPGMSRVSGYGNPPAQQQQPPQQPPGYGAPPPSAYQMPPQPGGQSHSDPAVMALINGMMQQMSAMQQAMQRMGAPVAAPPVAAQPVKAGMTITDVAKAVAAELKSTGMVGAAAPPSAHASDPIEAVEGAIRVLARLQGLSKTVEARFGAGAPPAEAVAVPIIEEEEKEKPPEYPYENVPIPDGQGGTVQLFGHPVIWPMKKKSADDDDEEEEESFLDKAGRILSVNTGIVEVGMGAVTKLAEGAGAYLKSKAEGTNRVASVIGAGAAVAEKVSHIPYDAKDAGSGDGGDEDDMPPPPPPAHVNGRPQV